jgi:hypothetical protein
MLSGLSLCRTLFILFWGNIIQNLPQVLPTKFWFIWLLGFRGEDFCRNQPMRNKNCLWWPCLLTDQDEMSTLYRRHSIDASYQVWVHLAKRFQRRFFRNQPIRNKNCLWRPCLLTNRDEIINIYRGSSIYASYQVVSSFGQAIWEKILLYWPIRNKNCLRWPCLLTGRDEMSNLNRGPPIDASYHILVHLAKHFGSFG